MPDKIIRVVAAVIQRKDKYLIAQRPLHKRHGGLWEFPGGKLQDKESLFDAAKRELQEELGVQVTETGEVIYTSRDEGSPFLIEFVETKITGEPKPLEHSALEWSSINNLNKKSLAPTDAKFVLEYLKKKA